MSKAHDPHWRYIALRLGGHPVSRRSLQNAITGRARKEGVAETDVPRLTRFDWPHAIVRLHHHAVAAACGWLPRTTFAIEGGTRHDVRLTPIKTSGTIKALTRRLGVLEGRGPRPPKVRGPDDPRARDVAKGAGITAAPTARGTQATSGRRPGRNRER